MMDEACLNVGNTTDKQLLDAMDSQLAQSKYYSSKKKDATKNKVVCKKINLPCWTYKLCQRLPPLPPPIKFRGVWKILHQL